MAIDTSDTGIETQEPTLEGALLGLVEIARTVPSEEANQALAQLASLSGINGAAITQAIATDAGALEFIQNPELLKNTDIALQIAGISTGIIEQGLNVQMLAQNEGFQQIAHYVYDRDHGEGAWAARVREEIEDSLFELSDAEYEARHNLHAIAQEHGVQSEEFIKASVEYYEQFPQRNTRWNAHHREVEYMLDGATRSLRNTEREIEYLRNDDSLTDDEKASQLEYLERELEIHTERRDRIALQWGRQFTRPMREHETGLKLAQTLFDRLSESEEFLVNAEAEYNRLAAADTPPRPTWEEHIAQLEKDYQESWNPFASRPDSAALLSEWAKGRIDQKAALGQFDFSKMEEYGLDTGIFEASDLQNVREDDAQSDMTARFGRAWLTAAEIVYDGRNGREKGAWAEHLKTTLETTLEDASSSAEREAAENLIKIAEEHGATSEEYMNAVQAFMTEYPDAAATKAIYELNAELAKQGEWALRWQDGNLGSALRTEWTRGEEYQAAVRYLVRLDEYTRYEWGNDFWQDMGVGILDPTQVVSGVVTVGAAVYTGGTAAAPTAAGATAARMTLFRVLTAGMATNAVEGALTEGLIENSNQNLDVNLGVRSEKDMTAILFRGGMGGAMGAGLGVVFAGGGHALGKGVRHVLDNTAWGKSLSTGRTDLNTEAPDFIGPRLSEETDTVQLGPTIEAAAALRADTAPLVDTNGPAGLGDNVITTPDAVVIPSVVDADPVITNRAAPELDTAAPDNVVSITPEPLDGVPAIDATITAPEAPAAPVIPLTTPRPPAQTAGAFTPWLSDPRIAASPFNEATYGRPVFAKPNEGTGGPTPRVAPRASTQSKAYKDLAGRLQTAYDRFAASSDPADAKVEYDAVLSTLRTEFDNGNFSPNAKTAFDALVADKDSLITARFDRIAAAQEVAAAKSAEALATAKTRIADAEQGLDDGLRAVYASVDDDSEVDAIDLLRDYYDEISAARADASPLIIEADRAGFNELVDVAPAQREARKAEILAEIKRIRAEEAKPEVDPAATGRPEVEAEVNASTTKTAAENVAELKLSVSSMIAKAQDIYRNADGNQTARLTQARDFLETALLLRRETVTDQTIDLGIPAADRQALVEAINTDLNNLSAVIEGRPSALSQRLERVTTVAPEQPAAPNGRPEGEPEAATTGRPEGETKADPKPEADPAEPEADADGGDPKDKTRSTGRERLDDLDYDPSKAMQGAAQKAKTLGDFVTQISDISRHTISNLRGKELTDADFIAARNTAVRDLTGVAYALDIARKNLIEATRKANDIRKIPESKRTPEQIKELKQLQQEALSLEVDIVQKRDLAVKSGLNITVSMEESLDVAIRDMLTLATDIGKMEKQADFEDYYQEALGRIRTRNALWKPQDFILSSAMRPAGLRDAARLNEFKGVDEIGQRHYERLQRRLAHGLHLDAPRKMPIGDSAEGGMNIENYGLALRSIVEDANKAVDSPQYLQNLNQTLWEAYERGLEEDLFAVFEYAVNAIGDQKIPNTKASDPIQRFNVILESLMKYVDENNIRTPATKDAPNGKPLSQDPHFKAYVDRMRYEAAAVWSKNPQGTLSTFWTNVLGKHYDGGTFTRRERRRRVAFNTLNTMIHGQFREQAPGSRWSMLRPWTDAGRTYWSEHQVPRFFQYWGNYLIGKEIDFVKSYTGEDGFYNNPQAFRYAYKGKPEGHTTNWYRPWSYFAEGTRGRQVFNIGYRWSGAGFAELALFHVPSSLFNGWGAVAGSRNVMRAARTLWLAPGVYTAGSIVAEGLGVDVPADEDIAELFETQRDAIQFVHLPYRLASGAGEALQDEGNPWYLRGGGAILEGAATWPFIPSDAILGASGAKDTYWSSWTDGANGPAPIITTDENGKTVIDPTLAASLEADYVRKWVDAKLEDAAEVERLKLPNGYWSAEEDATYRDRVIVEAAKLLQADAAKPAADRIYPAINRSGANNFEAVWTAARTNVNGQIRATMIENALVNAYRKDRNRDESYDPKADPQNKFTDVLALLIKESEIAPINSALMVTDPWDDTTQDAFVERAMYYQQMVIERPQRVQLVKDLIIAELGLDKDNLATDVQQALNTISTRYADMQGLNGNFYSLDGLRSSKDQIVEAFNTELNKIQRTAAATAGFTAWLEANQGNMPEFTDLSTARQNEVKAVVIERLATLPATPFTNAILASTDNADLNAKREEFVNEAITAILTLPPPAPASTPKIEGDTDGNGDLSDAEKAALAAKRAAAKPGTDFSLSLADTKSAASNVFNSLTDIDGDGVSAFIDTEFGRSVSGTFQQITGAATSMFGNLRQTESGKQMIGIGAGVIAALALPNLAKNIPILKHIANIPVVGGIAMAFLGFFLATKGANAIFNGALDAPDKTDPKDPAATTGDEGDKTGGEGDTQGGGGHLPVEGKGYKVKIQTHDGKLPQIITIEGDFDGDPETKEIMNLFDTNRDGVYAAQLFSADGSESWVAPSLLGKDVVDGALNLFVANAPRSRASLEANQEIKVEAIDNNDDGQIDSFKLTIGGTEYTLDHKLDGIMDDADLKTLEPQQ